MPSCHERNNAASQLCYYIACVIVICVVSAIMSRVKYALNTRYARKQNLKLRCTYLRCIFVLDFCRTIVFGHFCLPQSCLLPDHCFWSLLSAAKFFCRTVVFGHHFPSPFSGRKAVGIDKMCQSCRCSRSLTRVWLEYSPRGKFFSRSNWLVFYEAGKFARPIRSPLLGMDGAPDWQKIRTHGFDWLS